MLGHCGRCGGRIETPQWAREKPGSSCGWDSQMQYSESASSEIWMTDEGQFKDVTHLELSITTSGNPVLLQLEPTASAGEPNGLIQCSAQNGASTFSFFRFVRDGAPLPSLSMGSSL